MLQFENLIILIHHSLKFFALSGEFEVFGLFSHG